MSRCIIHNNVITLYCKNESKPLCVSCSYLSQIHKTHKVVPLDKAEKEVKVDLNSIRPEVKKAIKAVDEMILLNSKNNIKGEEKYPKIIEKITKFYTELE